MEKDDVSEELGDWQQVHFITGSSVFSPRNHEDLQISNSDNELQQLQEPEPIHTPSPAPPPDGGDGVRRWMKLHIGALQAEIFRLRNCVTFKVGVWSFAWIAGGVAVALLVSLWQRRVLIWWQRRLQLGSSKKRLVALIDEKDKKINQLILQIVQMNEMLQARRRIPVIRVKWQMNTRRAHISPYNLFTTSCSLVQNSTPCPRGHKEGDLVPSS